MMHFIVQNPAVTRQKAQRRCLPCAYEPPRSLEAIDFIMLKVKYMLFSMIDCQKRGVALSLIGPM